jgi:DNA-directed RNA polymerase subunit RPC12/RpoP
MARKGMQRINLYSHQVSPRKVNAQKRHMLIVRCTCGSKILVVPDLKAMNRAVNNHTVKHKKTGNHSKGTTMYLTKQILIKASKMNTSN